MVICALCGSPVFLRREQAAGKYMAEQVVRKNRQAVYCFYDKDGIVDGYVPFFLKGLREVAHGICVVVNGEVCDSGLELLRTYSDEVIYSVRKRRCFFRDPVQQYIVRTVPAFPGDVRGDGEPES